MEEKVPDTKEDSKVESHDNKEDSTSDLEQTDDAATNSNDEDDRDKISDDGDGKNIETPKDTSNKTNDDQTKEAREEDSERKTNDARSAEASNLEAKIRALYNAGLVRNNDTELEIRDNCHNETIKYKDIDVPNGKVDLPNGDKMKNYMQNIKMSNSTVGFGSDKIASLIPDSTTVVKFSPIWKQSLTASAAILLTFTAGLTSGYSGILLPQLKEPGSIIPWDEGTGSWIAAMAALPMAPGCLISGWMMEKFGRKTSHYMVCLPFLVGWVLIAFAKDLSLMLLGRFFTGLCVGLLGPLGPVYIGETSDPKYRGFFLAGVSLAIAVGILVAHIIGTFMTWQWTAMICCVFPVLSFLLLWFVPESPTWLISKGQVDEGVKSFYWLRGMDETAKNELKGLIEKQKAADSEPQMTLKQKLISLKSPELLKPLFIMIVFFITCQFSGVNAVAFYSIEIVEKAVGKGMDHYVAMLIIDSLRVVMSLVACVICKMYGRRPLCFISGVWTAISMVGLAMYLYWADGKQTNMSWLPLTCLLVYITAISIGLVPLPWIMCGEVFPTRVRGLGSGISSATTFAAFFVVVKTAPGMMANLGEIYTFLIYGIIALVGTCALFFILPETKGKSLQEIEDKFKSNKKNVHEA